MTNPTRCPSCKRPPSERIGIYCVLRCNNKIHDLADRCEAMQAEIRLLHGNKHPGYVIGQHWLTTAYEFICAGDSEEKALAEFRYVPESRCAAMQVALEKQQAAVGAAIQVCVNKGVPLETLRAMRRNITAAISRGEEVSGET